MTDDDEPWLRARDQGSHQPSPPHDRVASYDRLIGLLRERGQIRAPAAARIQLAAALDAATSPPGRRARAWLWLGGPLAAAVVIAVWLGVRGSSTVQGEDVLALEVRPQRGVRSSPGGPSTASVGDELVINARHPALRELRVYLDDRELIARCPGSPSCVQRRDGWTLTIQVSRAGDYRAIRVDHAGTAPTGSLDGDVSALRAAGASLRIGTVITIR